MNRTRGPWTTGRAWPILALLVLFLAASWLACGGGGGGAATTVTTATPTTPVTTPELTDANKVAFHASITNTTSSTYCITCHGDMTDATTLNPSIASFHARKKAMLGWDCTVCHAAVDLLEGSGGNVRKQVNVQTACYPCHYGSGPGPKLYE